MSEEGAAWRRRGEVEEATANVDVGASGRKTGEEVGASERKTGEEDEGVLEMSLGGEEGAAEKKTSEEAAGGEGMTTAEVGGAEGRWMWGEEVEEAPLRLRRCCWPKRSPGSPFSPAESGNRGTD